MTKISVLAAGVCAAVAAAVAALAAGMASQRRASTARQPALSVSAAARTPHSRSPWFARRRRTSEAPRSDTLSRRKQDFLGLLSHELRNPLSAIDAALAVMRSGESHDAGQQARRVIERQIAHISRLVEDLVDTARIERGTLSLQVETVDIRDVLGMAVEMVRPSITARRQVFVWEPPPEPAFVNADRIRLQQVFSNLLLNASKYTPVGGRIELTVNRVLSDVCVAVRDTGTGIAPEAMPDLFEPFVRGSRDESGLGVGLYVARTLVEQHGGQIGVMSDGADSGATFTVRLPELSPLLQRL